jgi:hypothetical protein
VRHLIDTQRSSWSQPVHSRYHIGEYAVGPQFLGLEDQEEVWAFRAPTPGQRWRAFLPRMSCIGDDGFLSTTSAYTATAKRWSNAGSKARTERWVPVGRSKIGLRLDSGAGTSICRCDH